MRNRSLLSLALIAFWLSPGPASAVGKCERLVATGNPEYPPYLWRDPQHPDKLIGAGADLLQEVGRALKVRIDVIYTGSWARAQEEVRSGRVDMLAGTFLTLPRLGQMDYVHPPFYQAPSMVWVRKGRSFPYFGWDDLRGRKGGTLVNNSFGQGFDAYAKDNLTLEQVPSMPQVFRKLLLGRTDYALFERYPGMALLGELGLQDELETLEPPISSEGLYFSVSHNSACNDAWLRGQLAIKVTELAAAGIPEALLQRNLERWHEQSAAASGQ